VGQDGKEDDWRFCSEADVDESDEGPALDPIDDSDDRDESDGPACSDGGAASDMADALEDGALRDGGANDKEGRPMLLVELIPPRQ